MISEAIEAGEMTPVEGVGRPIAGLDATYDPAWWVKAWVKRELADPRTEQLEDQIREELLELRDVPDEFEVRRRLADLYLLLGQVRPAIDVEGAIRVWRRGGAPALEACYLEAGSK